MWASILGMLISGCATQLLVGQAISNPAERMEFDGISVLPPQGEDWVIGMSPIHEVIFKKLFSGSPGSAKVNSYLLGVMRHNVYERELKSPQDLIYYANLKMKGTEARFQDNTFNVVIDETRSNFMGTDCINFNFTTKESNNLNFPGEALVLTGHGFYCRHPSSSKVIIEAFCTERYPEDGGSLLSETIKGECTAFLHDVQFKPLHTQTDTSYLNTPAWESSKWQQMITAAKLANVQNEKLRAEQLCYQAIGYSDSNTIKALFEYADFLEDKKSEDSLAVRAKARRLMELKAEQAQVTQAKSTYLGFVPWQMLNEYANQLEKQLRTVEAESMRALGRAYQYSQEVHATRMKIILQGGGVHGLCVGFDE